MIDVKTAFNEIVFVLDRSGSMSGLEKDTIGGYNSFLNQQKQSGTKAIISTVQRYQGTDSQGLPATRLHCLTGCRGRQRQSYPQTAQKAGCCRPPK